MDQTGRQSGQEKLRFRFQTEGVKFAAPVEVARKFKRTLWVEGWVPCCMKNPNDGYGRDYYLNTLPRLFICKGEAVHFSHVERHREIVLIIQWSCARSHGL